MELQEVKEAEEKIGLSCWSRSDSAIPVLGTCEKCKSSNQVIFEPKYKKVNALGSNKFTNYLCVDCCCEERGIKPQSSSPKCAKCDDCHQEILGDYVYRYPKGSNTILCENCCQRKINQDNNDARNSSSKPVTLSETLLPSPVNNSKPNKNNDKLIFLEAKKAIRDNEKIDIDNHGFTEEEKKELQEIEKEFGRRWRESINEENQNSLFNSLIIGSVIGIVILVKVFRRKKVCIKTNNKKRVKV